MMSRGRDYSISVKEYPATRRCRGWGPGSHTRGRWWLCAGLLLALVAARAVAADESLLELPVRNSVYRVHKDEYEIVKNLIALGVSMNLSDGRANQMFLPSQPLTVEQLEPIRKLSRLTTISLPWWATDETVEVFTRKGAFGQLKSLGFGYSKISDAGLRNLENLPALECMNVSIPEITDEGVAHVAKVKTLVLLRLNGTALTDEGLRHLAGHKRLHHLELNNTRITDAGLAHLAENTALKTLFLKGTSIDGSGLAHLAGLPRLWFLNLDDTRLDDRGMSNLAEFPNLRRIQVLYLANTKITDAGIASLERLSDLTVLNLSGTEMTDAGLRHLTNHPKIYNLGLGPQVTAEGYKWLEANAKFAYPFRQAVHTKPAQKPRRPEAPARTPPADASGRKGITGLIDALGDPRHGPEGEAAIDKLAAMKAEAARPVLQYIVDRKERGRSWFAAHAGAVLAQIGADAVPIMVEYYGPHHEIKAMRETIHTALTRAEYDLRPFAAELLESPDPALRYLGVDMLQICQTRKKPLTRPLAEKLMELLKDPDAEVRTRTAQIAGYVTVCEAEVAGALVEALVEEEDKSTAWYMVNALGIIGKSHAEGSPVVLTVVDGLASLAADHPEYSTRYEAIDRLGVLGMKAEPAVPVLQSLSDTPNLWLSRRAKEALNAIGFSVKVALRAADVDPWLADVLVGMTSSDSTAYSEAFDELVAKGPGAIDAMLIAARADETDRLPARLAEVLARWETTIVWPKLAPFVRDESPQVRRMIALLWGRRQLARLPEAAGEYLRDEEILVRDATLRSLIWQARQRESQARGQIGALLAEALEDEGWGDSLWSGACYALAECYPDYADAVPVLTRLLRETRLPSSRDGAADSLYRIARQLDEGSRTFDVILTALIEALENEVDEDVQAEIVRALGYLEEKGGKALDALSRAEKSHFAKVSRAAAHAIQSIEKAREKAAQKARGQRDGEAEAQEAPEEPGDEAIEPAEEPPAEEPPEPPE